MFWNNEKQGKGNNVPKYEEKHIIVDDNVIATKDVQQIISPVWWSVSIYEDIGKYNLDLMQFTLQQRYVFAIQWYSAEVNNGGHYQFYSNSTGIVWKDALKGFQAIGAKENEEILRESACRLGGTPSQHRDIRKKYLDEHEVDFSDLDDRYYKSETAMCALLYDYIRRNASSFYFNGEVIMPN
jgi:hypothetical protein